MFPRGDSKIIPYIIVFYNLFFIVLQHPIQVLGKIQDGGNFILYVPTRRLDHDLPGALAPGSGENIFSQTPSSCEIQIPET
jgi:hypothetical protein